MNLSNTQLFRGLEEHEITSLLSCLNTVTRSYKKGEIILSEGMITENIGVVLSGMVLISYSDIWGNDILGKYLPKYMPVLGNAATRLRLFECGACIRDTCPSAKADHCICRRARNRAVYECGAGLDLLLQYLPLSCKAGQKPADCMR